MYPYMADQLCLNFSRSLQPHYWEAIMTVSSLLKLHAWEAALRQYPDKALSRFLVVGLRDGFRIGFNQRAPLKPAQRNMQSAHDHPEVIDAKVVVTWPYAGPLRDG